MMYIQIAKYGIIAIIAVFIYFKGYYAAEDKWISRTQAYEIAKAKTLQAYNDRAMEAEKKQAELAEKINNEALDNEQKIHALEIKLNGKLASNRMRQGLCKRYYPGRVQEAKSTGGTDEKAGEFELSTEFRQFLISNFRRAEEAGHYAEIASEWITENCKAGVFECGKQ